jgi:hypothetical protein
VRACRNTRDEDLCSHIYASLQTYVVDGPMGVACRAPRLHAGGHSLTAQLLRGALDADAPCSSEAEAGLEYDDGVKIGYLPDSLYPTAAHFEEHGPPAVALPAAPMGAAHVGGGELVTLVRVPAVAIVPPCDSGLGAVVLGKRAAPDGPYSDAEVDLRPRGPALEATVCQLISAIALALPARFVVTLFVSQCLPFLQLFRARGALRVQKCAKRCSLRSMSDHG